MKIIDRDYINKYDSDDYVWYACYGSNINLDRFMIYINGDKLNKLGNIEGCYDKTKPKEFRSYIFKCPIYFAGISKKWGGGMAFLDYENTGMSYGKIYKIKISQFKDILKQENELYDSIVYVDDYLCIPIFTFTSFHKLTCLNNPSREYCDVIKKGILDTYKELRDEDVDKYFKSIIDDM